MAGGIRGITIEIGGDTTKLGKAIGDTEKKSRALQVELRQVEKLLKFDPTNVELLSQKQKILTDNVSETSKKLDLLREAEEQVTEQFKRGEVSEEQVRALQREIIKTEGALDSMKSELNETETALKKLADGTDSAKKHTKEYAESVEKAKKEIDEFKDKASNAFNVIKTGALAIGGAIVATGGYALKLSTDFDKATNTLITKTGATADEIDGLNTAMENVYANNFGESIEDVANSMAIVKQSTEYVGEELQKATEDAILFRDTFGFEVEESVRSAQMLMNQFGLTSHEAYNLMAQGAQNGLNKNGDLMDVINEYSVHFKQLGFDSEEMFNILSAGAESGAFSVDKVGDAFKEFGIRVKDESDATMEAFSQLGLNAEETAKAFAKGGDDSAKAYLEVNKALSALDDPLKQNQIGVALYGTMWEDLGATVIEQMANYGDAYNSTIDTMKSINDIKYDDIGSALQGLGRTLETEVVDPLGDELKPVVEDIIDSVEENGPQIKDILTGVVTKVGEFVNFIVNNGPAIISVLAGIGAGFAVFKVASLISTVVSAMQAFKLANEGATISQTILNAVMNANPIVLIVTLIAGLVVALITFIATNDEARAKVAQAWETIKQTVTSVLESIRQFFSDTWEKIKNIWSGVKPFFENLWTSIKNIFSTVKSFFVNAFTSAWNGIKGVVNTWREYFSGVWTSIKTVFGSVKTWFRDTFNSAWTAIKGVFSGWGSFFSGLWTKIKNTFSKLGTNIASAIGGAVKSGINGVISSIERTINTGVSLINGAIDLINKLPGVSVGKLAKLSLPRLARGGIVDSPTIAEIGENGREAIIPLENNTEWIDNLANNINRRLDTPMGNDTALLDKLDGIYERLGRLQMVLDSGTLVGELIDGIDAGLANKQLLSARGV